MGENKVKQYDTINKPSHYHGKNGMEAIDVIENFIGDLAGKAGWAWGNSMKYLLRFQKKNGIEDVKKAFRNLVWVLEEIAGKKESLAFLSSLVKELENEQVHKESD